MRKQYGSNIALLLLYVSNKHFWANDLHVDFHLAFFLFVGTTMLGLPD